MLTYLPLLFQSALGLSPQQAGILMLPMAVPIFIVPRLVSRYLTHRLSGRTIITVGLGLCFVGLTSLGIEVSKLSYVALLPGMLIVGISAGFLNGETAKVTMTVIPPERAGMAAGVGGTIRFAGIVVGFAALGAVLFNRVVTMLGTGSDIPLEGGRLALVQRLVAGDHAAAAGLGDPAAAIASLASGYSAVFFTAGIVAGVAAVAAWVLIRRSDTAATVHNTIVEAAALPVE
jgi:hypothetical protein